MEDINDYDSQNQQGYEKKVTELLEEKELKLKWHREILKNVSMQEYFKNYHAASISTFISMYINEKYLAYRHADMFEQRVTQKRSRWIDEAHTHLQIIQNKKLFDLQCLWRAEQVTLEGVQICYDFMVWQDDILNCPFLEPVSREDIRMYQDFLLTSDVDFQMIAALYELQDYEEFKAGYTSDDGEPLPDWYEYHNVRTGNSALLLLPDTRGAKENFYIDIYRNDNNKKLPQRAPYVRDDRDYLSTGNLTDVLFFVNTFEDKETQKKYANYSELHRQQQESQYEMSELLMKMEQEEEYIPIEAHYDFKEAMVKAYNNFRLKKLAEHLPLAHEQYIFNNQMGFTIANDDEFNKELREKHLKMIMDGRELNGESRDLGF